MDRIRNTGALHPQQHSSRNCDACYVFCVTFVMAQLQTLTIDPRTTLRPFLL
jgi:hypothetical protein